MNSVISVRRTSESGTVIVWLGLMVYVVLVKLIITFVPTVSVHPSQAAALSWASLAVYGSAGVLGAWFAQRTGFPNALDHRISNRQRVLVPALLGLLAGSVLLITDAITGMSTTVATSLGVPSINVAFPGSVLIYSSAAILTEVIYRLLPIPVLLWLSGIVIRGNRAHTVAFWVPALIASAFEPVQQGLALQMLAPAVLALVLTEIFIANLIQASLFRCSGVLASIVMRLALYVVWHILGGMVR